MHGIELLIDGVPILVGPVRVRIKSSNVRNHKKYPPDWHGKKAANLLAAGDLVLSMGGPLFSS